MAYIPNPTDLSGVEIPEALCTTLLEAIARENHESWAKGRYDGGWRFGPARDDARKLTPDMVAYEDLPEAEREFDRATALTVLRLIVKMGYKIIPPG